MTPIPATKGSPFRHGSGARRVGGCLGWRYARPEGAAGGQGCQVGRGAAERLSAKWGAMPGGGRCAGKGLHGGGAQEQEGNQATEGGGTSGGGGTPASLAICKGRGAGGVAAHQPPISREMAQGDPVCPRSTRGFSCHRSPFHPGRRSTAEPRSTRELRMSARLTLNTAALR